MSLERVCVYGTLRRGRGNSFLLSNSKFLGEFKTEPVYNMYDMGCPFITHAEDGMPIITEVYEVDDYTSWHLDSLEGYPYFYNREQIDTPYGKAWIYFIDNDLTPDMQERLVKSGDWCNR